MPKTSFTCRDKILGGYYADSETQCQMFHVCVKVSGIGVQDFRFLCPNGTAFDQEAQICADWGDVDCEAATLYYGSDNFDLYRLGSGFESKRAPFAEEEEATFHLQRAETNDARRSKQYIVNQSSKPQQPPAVAQNPNQIPSVHRPQHHRQPVVHTTTTTTTTTTTPQPFTTTTEAYYNSKANNQYQKQIQQKHLQHKQQQLIFNQQQQIQQQHSHFFNNRNNGKEDFEDDYVRKPAHTSTAAPVTTSTTPSRAQTRGRNRGRGSVRAHNLNIVRNDVKPTPARQQTRLQATTPEDFVDVPKIPNYNRGSNSNFRQQPTTILQPQNNTQVNFKEPPASTPAPFSRGQRPTQNAATNRNSNTFFQPQQANTTPARTPLIQQYQTTTAFPQQQQQQQQRFPSSTPAPSNFRVVASTPASRINEQLGNFNNQPQSFQGNVQNPSSSTPLPNLNFQYYNRNPSNDYRTTTTTTTTTTVAPPQQNFNARVTQAPQFFNNGATERTEQFTTTQEPQRTRAQARIYNVDPGRLSQFNYNEYQGSRTSTTTSTTAAPSTPSAFDSIKPSTYNPLSYRPQPQQQHIRQHPQSLQQNPFDPRTTAATPVSTTTTLRPITNERYQTISRSSSDNHTPSSIKKFSTLVPKDQYNPTTFKPNALSKKALLQFAIQKPEKPQEKFNPAPPRSTIYVPTVPPVTSTTTFTPTTTSTTFAPPTQRKQQLNYFQQPQQRPVPSPTTTPSTTTTDVDEDDGQYHPELYEKDFYRNRVKAKFNQERKQSHDPLTSSRNNFFQQSTPVSQSLSSSDEDEIFRTAHSQNIAASGNDLILERARQAAAKINEFLSSSSVKPTVPAAPPTKKSSQSAINSASSSRVSPRPFSKAPTIPPNATSTKRPSDDKDEYDYAYYDTGSPDVPEYDIIEDFGRTARKSAKKAN
ncbi:hypothetical protein RP20_CCG015090 [Aedes albopictus]|nr:hypothetical protein RP20_CCG015090 [Aedes albopictus]